MIKIIAGVYGYKENGIILPKDKDSEPFSLDPEREAELVAQGVAEYANVIIPEAELEPEPETAGAEQQPAEDPAEPEACLLYTSQKNRRTTAGRPTNNRWQSRQD